VINQQGRPFTHAFEIHLEKATLFYEFAALADGQNVLTPLTVLDGKGKVERPAMPAGDPSLSAFEAEIKEFATAVKNNKPSPILSGELARDAIALCHKQTESVRKGKPVKV
jgi:predicted dehydrogenase